jgi:hypothetical protein
MLALPRRACGAQTKIAAGATSSPDESPLVLRCGRASTSVAEMRIATHHPSGVACGLNRTTISALTWSNLGKRRNGGAVKKGIEIEVIWEDQNVVEFQINCSNGYFSGRAEIYASHDVLPKFASTLSGFPSKRTDSRDFELGTFDQNYTDGGVRLHFYCTDSVGHAAVEVRLRGDGCKALGEAESVALRIPIEAAAIDSFVSQVRDLKREIGARAYLQMAK